MTARPEDQIPTGANGVTRLGEDQVTMRVRTIGYWGTTAVLAFVMLAGGAGELARAWGTLDTVRVLGYPPYLLTILGSWKLLGGTVLLAPRLPRVKEWAYAGVFFNMTGAAASHVFAGDYGPYAFHVVVTVSLAMLVIASWALRPESRAVRSLTVAELLPSRITA
jgi:hypothetical protein